MLWVEVKKKHLRDIKTLPQVAEELNMNYKSLYAFLQRHPELKPEQKGYLTKEEINKIKEFRKLEGYKKPNIPEGYKTLSEVADELGLTKPRLYGYLKYNNLLKPYYSEQDINKIKEIRENLNIPEGYKTIKDLAKELNLEFSGVFKKLKKHGYLKNKTLPYLISPEEFNEIIKKFTMPERPEGYYILSEVAEKLNMNYGTLRDYLQRHSELKPEQKGLFTEEEINKIRKSRENLNIPEGYKTLSQVAKELNTNYKSLRQWLISQGFLIGKEIPYLFTDEEINKIKEKLEF